MKAVIKLMLWTVVQITPLISAFGQVPNGGFENWTGGNPDQWSAPVNFLYRNITQSSTAHSGSSSLRGEILDPVKPVYLQVGGNVPGFAISGRPVSYSGYLQFNSVEGDGFFTTVTVYKNHTATALGDEIGAGLFKTETTTSGWIKYTVTINYTSNENADGAVMNFLLNPPLAGGPRHAGTYFLVDDLTLDGTTGVKDIATLPAHTFKLNNNYPNPFNPSTTISFTIPTESHVSLEILNVLGQRVAVLENENIHAGTYQRSWDGNAASGVYFYRLQAVGVKDPSIRFTEMKKMILMR